MIMLEEDEILDQQRSLIFENELTDDNSGSESTGLLQSSRDASKLPLSIGVRHVSDSGTRQ
jgi:hypothetical protein